jgi:hypothetical protein
MLKNGWLYKVCCTSKCMWKMDNGQNQNDNLVKTKLCLARSIQTRPANFPSCHAEATSISWYYMIMTAMPSSQSPSRIAPALKWFKHIRSYMLSLYQEVSNPTCRN